MNKPRIETKCYECQTPIKITRKRLEQVGNYPQCKKHTQDFYAWVGNLYRQQN